MKITNLQLEILTNTIYQKVVDKVDKKTNSAEFNKLLKAEKKKVGYDKRIKILKENEELLSQINILKERRSQLIAEYKNIDNANKYGLLPTISNYDNTIKNNVLKNLYSDYPSKSQIKSEIILNSISGKNDLMETILEKFEL